MTELTTQFFRLAHSISEETLLATVIGASNKGDVDGLRNFLSYIEKNPPALLKSGESMSQVLDANNPRVVNGHDAIKLSYATALAQAVIPPNAWSNDANKMSDVTRKQVEPFTLTADHRDFLLQVAQTVRRDKQALEKFFHAVAGLIPDAEVVKRLILDFNCTGAVNFQSRNLSQINDHLTSPLDEAFIKQNTHALAAMTESLPKTEVQAWLDLLPHRSFIGIGKFAQYLGNRIGSLSTERAMDQMEFLDSADSRFGPDTTSHIRSEALLELVSHDRGTPQKVEALLGPADSPIRARLSQFPDTAQPESITKIHRDSALLAGHALRAHCLPVLVASESYLAAVNKHPALQRLVHSSKSYPDDGSLFDQIFEDSSPSKDLGNLKAVCDLLISHGHEPTRTSPADNPSATTLHRAAHKPDPLGFMKLLLIAYDCDPLARNAAGKTPGQLIQDKTVRKAWTDLVKAHTAKKAAVAAMASIVEDHAAAPQPPAKPESPRLA